MFQIREVGETVSELAKRESRFFRRPDIQSALILFLGGIIGSLITMIPLLKQDQGVLIPLSKEWQRALSGTWSGIEIQEEGLGDSPVEFAAELYLEAEEKHITGVYRAMSNDPNYELKASFRVSGGLLHHRGRFLKLDYENRDVGVQGFGTILLVWTPKGSLEGRIIGFSAIYNAIAPATVQLRKAQATVQLRKAQATVQLRKAQATVQLRKENSDKHYEFPLIMSNFFRHRAIQAALIGFLGIIIGSLITRYGLPLIKRAPLSEKQDCEDLIPLPKEWQQAFAGTWVGIEIQEEGLGDSPVELSAKLTLIAKEKHITRVYKVTSKDPSYNLKASFNVTGRLLQHHGQFLKLKYENRSISVQQFGTMLLLLTPTGELKGRIVGFSAVYRAIVPGTVQLIKET
jgi:hypothetical protein